MALDQTPSDPIADILAEFQAAGVRPTPLGVISVATERGLGDVEIRAICDELAARPELVGAAA